MSDTKYCYPDTDVLINKLDIRDLDKLHIFERSWHEPWLFFYPDIPILATIPTHPTLFQYIY